MNKEKLSLADFKYNADKVETNEMLEKILGGTDDDCHSDLQMESKTKNYKVQVNK